MDDKDIIALPPGDRAPEDVDSIRIEPTPNGKFQFTGCVIGHNEFVSTYDTYDTFEEAKLAGYFWAKDKGATVVYVEDGRA